MKPIIILVALAPLALGACKFGLGGADGNTTTANAGAPGAVPDSVVVNGVTYVRAGAGTPSPSATIPASSALSAVPAATPTPIPPPISDTGSTTPPSTDTSSEPSSGVSHGP